jgi:hypothetical protein
MQRPGDIFDVDENLSLFLFKSDAIDVGNYAKPRNNKNANFRLTKESK